jgi:hypothetical protein
VIKLVDANGTIVAETQSGGSIGGIDTGLPIPIPANTAGLRVVVATGQRILGASIPEVDAAKQGQGG